MHLKLDDLSVPSHPSAIDLDLNLQGAGDAIKEARSIHRQLMGELQEARKATVSARAIALRDEVQGQSSSNEAETPLEDHKPPQQITRRVGIRPR
ncbi:MAG TPA: hypothetical protein V6C84_00745 [Coleofasciculaceae cyanobacterium]